MAVTDSSPQALYQSRFEALEGVSLVDLAVKRRSRRFALGHNLDGGPLTYRSAHEAVPLTAEEEAIIVFIAAGVTGFALADAPFATGSEPETGSANVLTYPFGRTISSVDGVNSAILFVLNDDGAFQIRRPQDYPRAELPELVEMARRHEFVELYERAKIRVADRRPEIVRRPPFTPPFNRWSTNNPGSTYFLLISDATPFVLSIVFLTLNEEMGYTIYDDRKHYRLAGLKRFTRSRGGHLHDDPNELRVGAILDLESYLLELAAVDQGLMLQNIQLATEALGLGGFPHYGAQKYQWFEALGFEMEDVPLSKLTRRGRLMTAAMNALGKNPVIPHPLGLVVDGEVTIKPYCPPWYGSMEEAVHAFVENKFGEGGLYSDGRFGPWRDTAAVHAGIERYSEQNIAAVVEYCEYVYEHYGRFPGNFGPLRSLMAFQAHHPDLDFYDRFYPPGTYHDRHEEHFARWHGENGPTPTA